MIPRGILSICLAGFAGQTNVNPITNILKYPHTFSVGIVGHRPNRLHSADLPVLASVIRETLVEIQDTVLAQPINTSLHAISPIAEGVDRIFAEQALELGWPLICPLPFPIEEYAKDFKPDVALEPESLSRFHCLLGRANEIIELQGERHNLAEAYAACGQYVLDRCDLLIAVWDGQPGDHGGTAELVELAIADGKPLIHIASTPPHNHTYLPAISRSPSCVADWGVPAVPKNEDEAVGG